jgi:hypothetical protein
MSTLRSQFAALELRIHEIETLLESNGSIPGKYIKGVFFLFTGLLMLFLGIGFIALSFFLTDIIYSLSVELGHGVEARAELTQKDVTNTILVMKVFLIVAGLALILLSALQSTGRRAMFRLARVIDFLEKERAEKLKERERLIGEMMKEG